MKRYKISRMGIIKTWDSLIDNLNSLSYTEEKFRGIQLGFISPYMISGVFYEKIFYTETIRDPIIGIYTEDKQSFIALEFTIYRNESVFILKNNTRTMSLYNFLSCYSYEFITLQDVFIDVHKFYCLACKSRQEFNAKSIIFNQFSFENGSSAQISISSIYDAVESSKKIGIAIPSGIKSLVFNYNCGGRKRTGSITKSGVISLTTDDFEEVILPILNNCICR